MYEVRFSRLAKKSLRKLVRSGSFSEQNLKMLLEYFIHGYAIPRTYRDHALKGHLSHLRECHLDFDLLLTYERDTILKTIIIANIGTHDELFK